MEIIRLVRSEREQDFIGFGRFENLNRYHAKIY